MTLNFYNISDKYNIYLLQNKKELEISMRIKSIDILKTIAIIAVVLYHIGLVPNGYLGVEIFYVISGYLFLKGNKENISSGTFKPMNFILKKLSAFWPLIVLGSVISLIVGYFVMLPDDYENLAESVIASNMYANNILQALTTRNYWNTTNAFKPLMHTWYISVLFQSFVFLALIFFAFRKITKKDCTLQLLIGITCASLILYILPVFSQSDKFYWFPFRLYEITLGGMLAYIPEYKQKNNIKVYRCLGYIGYAALVFLMFFNFFTSVQTCVILVTMFASLTISTHSVLNEDYGINEKVNSIITLPGKHSYDIYIWHQIIIAYLLYSVFGETNVYFAVLTIILTFLASFASVCVRKKLIKFKKIHIRNIVCSIATVFLCGISFYLYMQAGVVRDIPELEVYKNNAHRNMHAEYVDIPYSFDKDFESKDKVHILVLGNSFARDFFNILRESDIKDKIEISYIFGDDFSGKENRVEQADFVFYGDNYFGEPDSLLLIPEDKLYIVGNKRFGLSAGIFYAKRNSKSYYEQKTSLHKSFIDQNTAFKNKYGDHYIDMISPLTVGNEIKVFTDDNYYISQDGAHLTKRGAMYYSRILDLDFIYIL